MGALNDALTWGAVIASLGSIGTTVKIIVSMGARLQKADAAERIASAALAKVEMLSSDLTTHKLQAAREYATTIDLADAEKRFTAAVDGMREDFRDIKHELKEVTNKLAEIAVKLAARA